MERLISSGKLTGDRAAAAKELVRRSREGAKSERAKKIAELGNSATGAFMHSFANGATLGLADKAVNAVNNGVRALGFDPLSSEETEQVNEQVAADHPVADVAGGVAGTVAGGTMAGGAAARLGLKPAASFVGRALQNASAGFVGGATEQAIDGGDVGDMAVGGTLGAVVGGAGGSLAEKALAPIAPKAMKVWRKLAGKLRTDPKDMEAFVNDSYRLTGRMPPVAQAVHARDQGLLQGWASRHNTLGTEFNKAAQETRGLDLNKGVLKQARSDTFEGAMNPVRDSTVDIDPEILGSPHVADALAGPKMKDIRIKIGDETPLTVGDVDRIRKKLRGMQKAEPGGPFGDYADQLREDTAKQIPEYGEALERYSKDSKYLEGFEAGHGGRAQSEVSDKVQSAEGKQGLKAGAKTREGQQAMRNIAPGTPATAEEPTGLAEVGRGLAHAAVGSKGLGGFHAIRGMMDALPESYQQEIAKGLLARDPAAIRDTLGKLRKAGTDLKTIRNISRGIAGVLGADTSRAAGQ